MAKLMNGQLPMFDQTTSADSSSAISSLESAVGVTLSDLRAGLTTAKSGPEAAPVSRSLSPAQIQAPQIRAIFGLRGASSYESADLQRSLVSKLKRRLPLAGGTEFAMTWKTRLTPSRRSVSLLRASAVHTPDNDCSLWPTPVANDDNKTPSAHLAMKARMGGGRTSITGLQVLVKAMLWPTPTAVTATGGCEPLEVGRNAIEGEITWRGRKRRALWRTKPGLQLLAYGLPNRVGRLGGFGNAIVPQVAQVFIEAYCESRGLK